MNGGTNHTQFTQSKPAAIQMVQVDSSQIHAWGYSPEQNKLRVQFLRKGAPDTIYEYERVTPEVWAQLQAGESVGSTFHTVIKINPNLYPYTKVT